MDYAFARRLTLPMHRQDTRVHIGPVRIYIAVLTTSPTSSADPFRLPRPIRNAALARFGLDFDDGAAHARAALAVIAVHRKLAAEFLQGETREKVLRAVGTALLPGAEPTESRKAV